MRFRVGDLVYNKITQEKGRVVRIAKKNNRVSYIVVVVPATRMQTEKEALWRQYEVDDERTKNAATRYESAST